MDLIGKVPSLAPARGTSWHIGSLCFPRLAESKRIFLDKQILIGNHITKHIPRRPPSLSTCLLTVSPLNAGLPITMAGSKRVLNAKSDKFQGNIHKRGKVQDVSPKSSSKVAVGPIMLGFFLFVVVGSALLQIIRTATSGASLL